eukprot:TRINITY_DN2218_c0_g1_i1.p1 TRINITY_DN2218_c0_g1~~TRINITY_DN2218_c0_g1_i1.p1  ORF type:complete len:373 (+),score=50.89 TRINITY_DN2218_c0_g1_i1:668-1786(+)
MFPTEFLGRFLHFLALDGASKPWQRLAYLTCNNSDLETIAKEMVRPLVVDIAFDERDPKEFILPFSAASVVHIVIDWGDGTPLESVQDASRKFASHRYSQPGEYRVRVWPSPSVTSNSTWLNHLGWGMSAVWDRSKLWWKPLRAFRSLGSLGITSLSGLFASSDFNLPLDSLDMSSITNISFMFHSALSFNQPIEMWDLRNVTSLCGTFENAKHFNQPLGAWDVSKVWNMIYTFSQAESFNQPLNTWDVGTVTSMKFMFCVAKAFNHPIDTWNTSNVTDMSFMFSKAESFNQPIGSWDTSKVEAMQYMFNSAASFNQPIGNWNVSKVTNTSFMFETTSAFSQPLDEWDVSNVTNMVAMFQGAKAFGMSDMLT